MQRLPGPLGQHPVAERPDEGTHALTRHHPPGPRGLPQPPPATRTTGPLRRQAPARPAFCQAGVTGPLVRKVQRLLNDKAHSGLRVDGVFGPVTREAVLRYQRAAGLAADGIVGHATLTSLQAGGAAGLSSPTAAAPGRPPAAPLSAHPVVSSPAPAADVHSWSSTKILFEVFRRTGNKLPQDLQALWAQFATWENAQIAVGIFALGVAVQGVPVAGEIFDVAMVGLLLVTAGPAAFQGGRELGGFLMAVTGASTEADLDTAAEHLAHAITLLGVAAVLTWLHQRAPKAARRGSSGQASPPSSGSTSGGPRPAARTAEPPAPKAPVPGPAPVAGPTEVARQLIAKAKAAEPKVTGALQEATDKSGGKLVGLEHRLKTQGSLADKIARDVVNDDLTALEAGNNIGDALRYTAVLDKGQYASGANAVLSDLESQGFKVLKVKNTWTEGSAYKGVNSTLESPDGQVFELQFHTEESFAMKQATHAEYELMRNPLTPAPQQAALHDSMVEASRALETPPNVGTILRRP